MIYSPFMDCIKRAKANSKVKIEKQFSILFLITILEVKGIKTLKQ